MTTISQNSGGLVRVDMSRSDEYLRPEAPNLTFGQKLGRFMGKAVAFTGPIGAAVTAVAVPGIGLPIAAGLYGASNVAGYATSKAESKDAQQMQVSAQQNSAKPVGMPGLFEQSTTGEAATQFVIPQELNSQVNTTLQNKQMSNQSAVENFKFY